MLPGMSRVELFYDFMPALWYFVAELCPGNLGFSPAKVFEETTSGIANSLEARFRSWNKNFQNWEVGEQK